REIHGDIYDAMLGLYERREPIDLVTVTEELKRNKRYKQIGGSSYLTELVNAVPTAAHIEQYGKIVHDHFIRRRLIDVSAKITELSFNEGSEVKDVVDQSERELFGISQTNQRQQFIPIKETLTESFDRLDELMKKGSKLRGVTTGFKDLDSKLAGMQDSNLLILAARPGQGKTAFALGIAQYVSVREKLPVGIFSLEMSKEELVDRLLVAQADVDAWRLKTGRLEEEDFEKLSEAMGELAESPLFIDDTPGINILEMRTKARRLQAQHGLSLLVVDYLQLIHGRNLENRVQEVSEISQSLKNLARELKIPILAVSQLSRAVEQRGSKRPELADLRESGAIEQDSDVVMFIYREDPENSPEIAKLLIAKHRNGPLGTIDLLFKGNRIRFYEVEAKRAKKEE
ncbi:MAG TPA: replicative DNA helicase, partial [Patescibacteria group bacterium]|nr:replicative DNA helicase [Patescibacteria group bacterium]